VRHLEKAAPAPNPKKLGFFIMYIKTVLDGKYQKLKKSRAKKVTVYSLKNGKN